MKVKYTPGENGLNGKTYTVEITALELVEAKHIDCPLVRQVRIKYEDGTSEWISGVKLFNSTDMKQRALSKRVA